MAHIDEIIKREVNPFDTITFRPGNFWGEKQDSALTVESIHQEAVVEIEALLDRVAIDHCSRTVLLIGDSGSGKSYLLGRLKQTLNPKAFFAYIGPWAASDHIWRHTLRYTVDSLMQAPEGQEESQLILWLKGLAAFRELTMKELLFKEDVWNLLRSDRQRFVNKLRDTYSRERIYNADTFFGVLYCLTNPELYPMACEWLRGDDLSEESLQELKVRRCIDSEEDAKSILANFGKIATETKPIVLCFDNLDNIPRTPDNFQDLQPLLNINTIIHNEKLKNFFILISMITNNLRQYSDRIQQSDRARFDKTINLKSINIAQAEAIWNYRLKPIHVKADPPPKKAIFPLKEQLLELKFPGGKTNPRKTLNLGREEYQKYKDGLILPPLPPPPPPEDEFQLIWNDEYTKAQVKVTKISLLAAPELIKMLEEALSALEAQGIKAKLISGKYASYSLSYKLKDKPERAGVVWTEDPSMKSFVHVMNACQKVIDKNLCQALYLIRAAGVGKPNLVGNQIYRQVFTGSPHIHIKPILPSVHCLVAYHNLVNAAAANELVVAGKTINIKQLQELSRNTGIFNECALLKALDIIQNGNGKGVLEKVKKYLLSLIKTQNFLAKNVLIKNTLDNFNQVNQFQLEQSIQELCQEKQIQILNPKDKPEQQLLCWVPSKSK